MKRICRCAILILFALALTHIGGGVVRANANGDSTSARQRSIIFISDTQSPMWFEKLFVKTHRNDEATKILFNSIAADTTVTSVLFLGDAVSMSSFEFNWKTVDTFLTRLNANHISFYAAAGNHDYLLTASSGEANLKRRFPDFRRTGYTIRIGPLAVVLLNSNFGELEDSEKVQQQNWYFHELHTLDEDTTIFLVAVGCHHSPYSNSTIVGHSEQVRKEFVPAFLKSKKSGLFLSGHAHTFQHFIDSTTQKHFLVIGGGGGLLHTLKHKEPGDLPDQVTWESEYRMFHYVQASMKPDGMHISIMMLKEDLSGPFCVYSVTVPFYK